MFQSNFSTFIIASLIFSLGFSGCINNIFSPAKSIEGTWTGTNVHKEGYISQSSGTKSIDSMVNMTFVFRKIDNSHLEFIHAKDTLLLKAGINQTSYEYRKGSDGGVANYDKIIIFKAKKTIDNKLKITYQKSNLVYDSRGFKLNETTITYNGVFEKQK